MARIKVWLSQKLLSEMLKEAKAFGLLETGGLLIGYWADPYEEAVVTHITKAGPSAEHTDTTYTPDSEFDQIQISQIYNETGGVSTYLGDWHSHPTGSSRLSWLDKSTVLAIAESPAARSPFPLMGVVANEVEWCLSVYRYQPLVIAGIRVSSVYPEVEILFHEQATYG